MMDLMSPATKDGVESEDCGHIVMTQKSHQH